MRVGGWLLFLGGVEVEQTLSPVFQVFNLLPLPHGDSGAEDHLYRDAMYIRSICQTPSGLDCSNSQCTG
jgi:hypothetical protein